MDQLRRAKAWYKLGSALMVIRFPRPYHRFTGTTFDTERAGWTWEANPVARWCFRKAVHTYGVHWNHLMLSHIGCDPVPCPVCGGEDCSGD